MYDLDTAIPNARYAVRRLFLSRRLPEVQTGPQSTLLAILSPYQSS